MGISKFVCIHKNLECYDKESLRLCPFHLPSQNQVTVQCFILKNFGRRQMKFFVVPNGRSFCDKHSGVFSCVFSTWEVHEHIKKTLKAFLLDL